MRRKAWIVRAGARRAMSSGGARCPHRDGLKAGNQSRLAPRPDTSRSGTRERFVLARKPHGFRYARASISAFVFFLHLNLCVVAG